MSRARKASPRGTWAASLQSAPQGQSVKKRGLTSPLRPLNCKICNIQKSRGEAPKKKNNCKMLGRNPEGKKRLVDIGAKPRKKKNAKLQQQTLRFKHHGATPREEKKVWLSIKELTRNTKQRPQESVRKLASQVYLEKKKSRSSRGGPDFFKNCSGLWMCTQRKNNQLLHRHSQACVFNTPPYSSISTKNELDAFIS